VKVPSAGRHPEREGIFRAELVCGADRPQDTVAHPAICTYPAYSASNAASLHVRHIM